MTRWGTIMSEITEKLEDIGKRLHIEIAECKQCGSLPVIRTVVDEWDRESFIECKCGLRIPTGCMRFEDIIAQWNGLNRKDGFVPRYKPRYVGKPAICATCVQRRICVEARKISNLYEFACNDWVEEIVKEC